MRRFLALTLAATASLPVLAAAYGEPDELGLPSAVERALHFYTDQLRVAPAHSDSQFGDYPAVAPLAYNHGLGAAARLFADDMAEHGCFPPDHSSCDGTSFENRLSGFYSGTPIGENIAQGYATPRLTVFEGWLYSEGHRNNMLSGAWNEIGTGFPGSDPSLIWVQDFGGGGLSGNPITTSGTHTPLEPGTGGDLNYFLAVHDPAGQPLTAELVVEGSCQIMDDDRGSAGKSTYVFSGNSGTSRCVPYYFKLNRSDGEVVFYPTTGSLIVPVGNAVCDEWEDERSPADCAPLEDEELPGPDLGGTGQGCGDPSGDPNASTDQEQTAYGTCNLGSRRSSKAPVTLLLALLAGFGRRRAS